GFRYSTGIKMFEPRMRVIPQAADDLKACAQDILGWLDKEMAGKTWVCGDRFSLADILLFGFVDFFHNVDQPVNPELKNIAAHHARAKERPSASVE
ncbi:MAG: glutathione S-transferase C-terminal domain-containing protein, partial [Methyloligellaceae bacterium]